MADFLKFFMKFVILCKYVNKIVFQFNHNFWLYPYFDNQYLKKLNFLMFISEPTSLMFTDNLHLRNFSYLKQTAYKYFFFISKILVGNSKWQLNCSYWPLHCGLSENIFCKQNPSIFWNMSFRAYYTIVTYFSIFLRILA